MITKNMVASESRWMKVRNEFEKIYDEHTKDFFLDFITTAYIVKEVDAEEAEKERSRISIHNQVEVSVNKTDIEDALTVLKMCIPSHPELVDAINYIIDTVREDTKKVMVDGKSVVYSYIDLEKL